MGVGMLHAALLPSASIRRQVSTVASDGSRGMAAAVGRGVECAAAAVVALVGDVMGGVSLLGVVAALLGDGAALVVEGVALVVAGVEDVAIIGVKVAGDDVRESCGLMPCAAHMWKNVPTFTAPRLLRKISEYFLSHSAAL